MCIGLGEAIHAYENASTRNQAMHALVHIARFVVDGPPDEYEEQWLLTEARSLVDKYKNRDSAAGDLDETKKEFQEWIDKIDQLPDDEF